MKKKIVLNIRVLIFVFICFIVSISTKHAFSHGYDVDGCDSLKILSIDSYISDGIVFNAKYLDNEDHYIKIVLREFIQGNDSIVVGENYCFKMKKFFPWDSTEIMSSSFEVWVDLNEKEAILLDFIRYFEIFYVIEIL